MPSLLARFNGGGDARLNGEARLVPVENGLSAGPAGKRRAVEGLVLLAFIRGSHDFSDGIRGHDPCESGSAGNTDGRRRFAHTGRTGDHEQPWRPSRGFARFAAPFPPVGPWR